MSTAKQGQPLIIIGSGMAGYQLAIEVRRTQPQLPILMITGDSGHFYSKPLLSTALAKRQEPEQLIIANPEEQAAKLGIRLMTWSQVTRIDPQARQVQVEGKDLTYSNLVLALGAQPIEVPAPPGALHSVNDLDAYFNLRQELAGKKKLVVLGGGLVGVEMVQDLLTAGFDVSLVTRSRHLLPSLLPPPVAQLLEQALVAKGLKHYPEESFKLIDGQPGDWYLEMESGRLLTAEVALSALGLQPRIELARQAGLQVNRGIQVNRQLQTSDPHIYALGDCAEIEGLNLMYVQPLMASAKLLARQLLGEAVALQLPALPVLVKTSSCPVVAAPPLAGALGEWHCDLEPTGAEGRFLSPEGELLGFALAGTAVKRKVQLAKAMPPLLAP